MKFSIQPEHGIKQVSVTLWDAVADKPLCTFVDGVFVTEDKVIGEKLLALGYEPDSEEQEPEVDAAAEERAIREKAKDLGIKSWHVKSVEKLLEEIEKAAI